MLNLLRMGEGFTDFWFGDMKEDFLHPTIYSLGKGQLEVLKDFVLEENLFAFDRFMAVTPVSQVALHHPNRRSEVIQWFESVFTYLLSNENNKALIDSDFIAFCVGHFNGRMFI